MKKDIKRYALLGITGLMISGGLFIGSGLAKEVRAKEDHVFQVLFPVNTDHVFDFIMDPQELIRMTDAAAYGDLTFEEGATLFFRRYDGRAEEDYSSASDALVITNMGTADVEIVLSASISSDSMEKITLTDDNTFMDDIEASLYLALTDGEHTVPVTSGTDAVIRIRLPGSEGAEAVLREYRFWLVGAVNKNGDWSEVMEEAPKVTVTWSASAVPEEMKDLEVPETGEDSQKDESSEENNGFDEPTESVEGNDQENNDLLEETGEQEEKAI